MPRVFFIYPSHRNINNAASEIVEVITLIFFCYLVCEGYWHCGHSWPIVPASGDSEDDCGEADGM
jgi:hypothetical protein